MSNILYFISIITIIISRLLKNEKISKQIILISSGLIIIPIIKDWSEIDVYYTTDGISDIFILLTSYLIPIGIISNWNNINNIFTRNAGGYISGFSGNILYYELILNLGIILILNFICQDMISFYIYFEASLIPLFIMISLYGASNKDKASDYILIYTLLSSLFMLIGIALYEILLDNTDYQAISLLVLSIDLQCILFLSISIGLGVKTPIWPLHTWLPIVHSESPLAGSIILAGIILKLSIYGIIRLILPNLSEAIILYNPIIYILSIITIIYTSLITLRQTDLKIIIAYSSISHMSLCILGILSNNIIGISGSLILSIGHGLVSPGLFIIIGGILYDRYHNRLIFYYQGFLSYMPLLSIYLIILSLCNIGTPLSLNFIGELFTLTGTINHSPILGIISSLSILLSASYQMKLTNRLTGGIKTPYINLTSDCTYRETILMLALILPTLLLGIIPKPLLNIIFESSNLLYIIY